MTMRGGRWLGAVGWVVASLALGACGSSPPSRDDDDAEPPIEPPPGCLDEDGDGAGLGEDCAADDCDDTDPIVQSECGQDCDAHPDRAGCPCDAAGMVPCYTGPEGTAGIGVCTAGLSRCEDGVWTGCHDQRLPGVETCDGTDDDCNGEADDGLLSDCGTCGPCESQCAGPAEGCTDFAEFDVHGLIETPERYLTLDGSSDPLHVIWPSSSNTGKVFRVDTRTKEVLGAYWTGTGHPIDNIVDSPSRTAVDDRGNVVIANRGGTIASSFTKIAADTADCPDRNGDGVANTSSGWDDLLAFDDVEEWDDECILWHTQLPESGARPIALYRSEELDGPGSELGWVCTYDNQRCYQFEQETGELTGEEVDTLGVNPYGGALDRDGYFWIVGSAVGRFLVDDAEDSWESIGGGEALKRVIVDENNVPWFSGDDLYRWNRDDESFEAANLVGPGPGDLASDGQGSIWVATGLTGSLVWRVDNDEEMEWHTVDTPNMTFGIGADFEGQVWTFGSSIFPGPTASVVDIETEEVERVLDDCGGAECVWSPYVRGDITGLQRRNALAPAGRWSGLFEGCAEGIETTWHQIRIDADTPPGTRVVVSARMADTVQGLADATSVHLGTVPDDGAELALDGAFPEPGAFVRIDVLLAADEDEAAPVLRGVHVDYGCPSVIE